MVSVSEYPICVDHNSHLKIVIAEAISPLPLSVSVPMYHIMCPLFNMLFNFSCTPYLIFANCCVRRHIYCLSYFPSGHLYLISARQSF
jgi:hypothetical protein